jgi:hypothetical protein
LLERETLLKTTCLRQKEKVYLRERESKKRERERREWDKGKDIKQFD